MAKRINASDVTVKDRMYTPVEPAIVDNRYTHAPDFHKVYDEDGMMFEEFDIDGTTVWRLRGFVSSYHESTVLIREESMLPNPDVHLG